MWCLWVVWLSNIMRSYVNQQTAAHASSWLSQGTIELSSCSMSFVICLAQGELLVLHRTRFPSEIHFAVTGSLIVSHSMFLVLRVPSWSFSSTCIHGFCPLNLPHPTDIVVAVSVASVVAVFSFHFSLSQSLYLTHWIVYLILFVPAWWKTSLQTLASSTFHTMFYAFV